MTTAEILEAVRQERVRQDKKWGPQHHMPEFWMCVLGEEVGEAAKALLEAEPEGNLGWDAFREELIQVAAVAVAIVEDLENGTALVS